MWSIQDYTEAVLFSQFCMEQCHIKDLDTPLKRYLSIKYEQTGGHLKNAVEEGENMQEETLVIEILFCSAVDLWKFLDISWPWI